MTKKWLQSRLISLVKPKEISNAEYILKCTINNVNPSIDDPIYMNWIINEAYNDFNSKVHQHVRDLLIKGLKQHLILDFSKEEDCDCILDIIPDIVLREHNTKEQTEKLFEVILKEYRDTKLGDYVYHLNKGFGITSYCYFNDKIDGIRDFRSLKKHTA